MFGGVFRDRVVWLSGHTGFKGAWLTRWLIELGAEVHGYALEPPTKPSLFEQLDLARRMQHEIADVRDESAVEKSISRVKPDFVFHLAAQPLVRLSYQMPVETFETNVMGTVHVLEALRNNPRPCAAVFVTTDKCYENREWLYAYREEDPLGGHDPYSSSKGAAEIAIAAYRRSFFAHGSPVKIASARAGNVVGGGDWAVDRILPDSIRALMQEAPIPVRNKRSTRPWQHVLEPLSGYLRLAQALARATDDGRLTQVTAAFNFGPQLVSNRTVEQVVNAVLASWPGRWEDRSDPNAPHEAARLNLAIDKAFHLLDWSPLWDFETTIRKTVEWYRRAAALGSQSARAIDELTVTQIREYEADAQNAGLSWTEK